MRIIIDGHGRIDRQAMAVERLKTIDMTPAGGGDAQDWVGAWLDGFDQALDLCRALETALDADTGEELSGDARRRHEDRNEEAMGRAAASAGARHGSLEPTSKAFDRLMQEHKKERETKGARP